jgi:uncharacterized protein YuzE
VSEPDNGLPRRFRVELEASYSPEDDHAYIYFDSGDTGSSAQHLLDEPHSNGMIAFDFAADRRMIGFEVIGASKALPHDLFEQLTTEQRPVD